jgi:hypothetical protein
MGHAHEVWRLLFYRRDGERERERMKEDEEGRLD